jgi:hypothetical protein
VINFPINSVGATEHAMLAATLAKGETVLENINVDYGPNGWATFNDGSPVQIKLTLQFKETVIVDKNRIRAGY